MHTASIFLSVFRSKNPNVFCYDPMLAWHFSRKQQQLFIKYGFRVIFPWGQGHNLSHIIHCSDWLLNWLLSLGLLLWSTSTWRCPTQYIMISMWYQLLTDRFVMIWRQFDLLFDLCTANCKVLRYSLCSDNGGTKGVLVKGMPKIKLDICQWSSANAVFEAKKLRHKTPNFPIFANS